MELNKVKKLWPSSENQSFLRNLDTEEQGIVGDKKPSKEELELLALVLSLIEIILSIMASLKTLLEG